MLIILFWNTIFLVWIIAVGFIFPLQIAREDGWRFMNMDDTPPSPLSYIAVLKLCERPSLWRELRKLLKVDQSGCRLMNEIPPTPLPLPRHHFPRLLFPNCARGRLSTMTGVTSRLQRWFEENNFPDELSKIKICRTRIITQLLFQVNLKCWEFDQALILVMTLLGFGFVITLVVRPSVEAMEVLSINRNDQENMNAIVFDDFLCLVISWILDDAPSLSTNSHRNFDSELSSWYFAEDTLGLCK